MCVFDKGFAAEAICVFRALAQLSLLITEQAFSVAHPGLRSLSARQAVLFGEYFRGFFIGLSPTARNPSERGVRIANQLISRSR